MDADKFIDTNKRAGLSKLEKKVLRFVEDNPSCDVDDIASAFGISVFVALRVSDKLLREGLVDFED